MRSNRSDGNSQNHHSLIQPNIGLDPEVRHAVIDLLNLVLADEVVLTTKTRCAHWNVDGVDSFILRTLFESQYQLLNNSAAEIAERVRMLGGFASGSLTEYLRDTRLSEQPGGAPDSLHLLADHETSIRFLREDTRKCTEEYEDAGTNELLVGVMRMHEKIAWVLRCSIEDEAPEGTKPAP